MDPTNSAFSGSIASPSLCRSESSYSSSSSSTTQDPFSRSTKAKIREECRNRCVVCMRRLGDAGQCAHVLDSADEGSKMATFATKMGVLEADYSRSSVANGIVLCSSCHQDLFTPNHMIISPPQQVLAYLIEYVTMDKPTPIHEVLDRLLLPSLSHVGLPDPQHVLPYLGLYKLVALAPEELRDTDFGIWDGAEVSELVNGHWSIVPPNEIVDSSITARIHDARALPPTHTGHFVLKLSATPLQEHFWRMPTKIAPILTYLLHHVAPITDSDTKEIQLAIELRLLLSLRYARRQGLSSGPGGGGNLGGGGNKREHDEDDPESRKRPKGSPSGKKPGGKQVGGTPAGGKQVGTAVRQHKARCNCNPSGLRFDGKMTTDQIIFAARGIILF